MNLEDEIQPLDFSELETSFDFDIEAFSFDEKIDCETRFVKPPKSIDKIATWKNAQKTAAKINVEKNMNYFGIIDGSFIFGDLIEALLVGKILRAHRLDIQTLSLSQDNVDSLEILLVKGYVNELNLIVSDYFFAHERNSLIPYIYEKLDFQNRFQLVVAGTHTKIITAKLTNDIDLVIHGSANLRSSGNIEQISIQDSSEILQFITEINDRLITKFKTINKSIRGNKLWQHVHQTAVVGK